MRTALTVSLLLFLSLSFVGQPTSPASPGPQQPQPSPSAVSFDPAKPIKVALVPEAAPKAGIDPWWKDVIDAAAKIGSVVGTFLTLLSISIAAFVALSQFKRNREIRQNELDERKDRLAQRQDELAWKKEEARREDDAVRREKANLARTVLSEMSKDAYANDAMSMLDWDEREYDVRATPGAPAVVQTITERDVWAGLRFAERHFVTKERYIRDCFDHFFSVMKTLEYYITAKLVEIDDVRDPFAYFADQMRQDGRWMYEYFINEYHPAAAEFLNRFPQWADCTVCEGTKVTNKTPCSTCAGTGSYTPPDWDKAYFMFDCPPRTERFIVRVDDKAKIQVVRESILTSKQSLHLTGQIVDGETNYNSPWPFHLDPATVDFVESDFEFAERLNARVEKELKQDKCQFSRDDIWHTTGARLLAEVPADTFGADQTWSENMQRLSQLGRIAGIS